MSDNTITIDESDLEQLVEQKVQERAAETAEQTGTSRRRVLASLAGIAGAGALGYTGGQRVAADPSDAAGTVYFEQIGDSNNPVSELYVDQEFGADENIEADTVEMKDGQVSNILSLDDDPTDDKSWWLFDDANDLRLNFKNGDLAYQWLSFRNDNDVIDIGSSVYDVDLDLTGGNIDNVGSVSADDVTVGGDADVDGVLTATTVDAIAHTFPDTNWSLRSDVGEGIALTYESDGFGTGLNKVVQFDDSAYKIHFPQSSGWTVDGNGNDFTNIGSVSADDVTVGTTLTDAANVDHTGELDAESVAFEPGHTNWEDGLSNTEIWRVALQSGETFIVERIEFRQKGGGASTNASLDVRDISSGVTIGSQNLGGTTKDPGSSGAANTVVVRLSNSTGNSLDAAPRVTGHIEGA
jgi:hypothetical protein